MAQYAQIVGRTRPIAGAFGPKGCVDGPALSDEQFMDARSIALDTTVLAAGPQLIIGDGSAVRCLNLRTDMVTIIAGGTESGRCDGPASRARFDTVTDIAVASNGALFVV